MILLSEPDHRTRGPIPANVPFKRELFSATSITAVDRARETLAHFRQTHIPVLIERRSFNAEVRATSNDEHEIEAAITDENITDRHGTVVRIAGLSTENYMRNPVVGWSHNLYGSLFGTPDPEHVIGRTVRLRQSGSRLVATIRFLPESVNPVAERIYQMVRHGAINATSIGFIPKRVVIETIAGKETPIVTEAELLEVSIVPLPSNVGAEITSGRNSRPDTASIRSAIQKGMNAAAGDGQIDGAARRIARLVEVAAAKQELTSFSS